MRRRWLALGAACTVLAAGCGGDDDGASESAGSGKPKRR